MVANQPFPILMMLKFHSGKQNQKIELFIDKTINLAEWLNKIPHLRTTIWSKPGTWAHFEHRSTLALSKFIAACRKITPSNRYIQNWLI